MLLGSKDGSLLVGRLYMLSGDGMNGGTVVGLLDDFAFVDLFPPELTLEVIKGWEMLGRFVGL
jgi:hypothetical protein